VPGKCGESWRAVILIATCCTVICLALVNVATLIAQQILTTLSNNSNSNINKQTNSNNNSWLCGQQKVLSNN